MTDLPSQNRLALHDAKPPITWGYWVIEGQFLAGAYPGSTDPQKHRLKIQALLDAGIRTIINLTEPTETGRAGRPFTTYEPAVRELGERFPDRPQCLRFPIPDLSVPAPATMTVILDAIDAALAAGRPMYLHCWGGVGRTSTVGGCWLLRSGLATPTTVFDTLDQLRQQDRERGHRAAPENEAQRRFVQEWPAAKT